MTLEERLCLARAGYSAQDIAGFEAAQNFTQPGQKQDTKPDQKQDTKPDQKQDTKPDQKQDPQPDQKQDTKPDQKQDPKPDQQQDTKSDQKQEKPIWAAALEKSISDLTKAMQASNRQFVDMGDPETPAQQAEQALATYITGAQPEKSKTGGKRK